MVSRERKWTWPELDVWLAMNYENYLQPDLFSSSSVLHRQYDAATEGGGPIIYSPLGGWEWEWCSLSSPNKTIVVHDNGRASVSRVWCFNRKYLDWYLFLSFLSLPLRSPLFDAFFSSHITPIILVVIVVVGCCCNHHKCELDKIIFTVLFPSRHFTARRTRRNSSSVEAPLGWCLVLIASDPLCSLSPNSLLRRRIYTLGRLCLMKWNAVGGEQLSPILLLLLGMKGAKFWMN